MVINKQFVIEMGEVSLTVISRKYFASTRVISSATSDAANIKTSLAILRRSFSCCFDDGSESGELLSVKPKLFTSGRLGLRSLELLLELPEGMLETGGGGGGGRRGADATEEVDQ